MEHVVERAGSRLHGWTSGPERAPVVALTHGATMDHRMFASQVDALTGAGYRTLTWDLRGHGRSKPLGEPPVTIGDLTDDLLALLDAVGADRPVCLVGQSLGGFVVQELVFRRPERVASVVLVGTTCTTTALPRWQGWALRSSTRWLRLWPERDLRARIARTTSVRPDVRAYVLQALDQMTREEFFASWDAVATAVHPEPGYRIPRPVLLTHGDRDRSGAVARSAPAWAAREPDCRYEVVPDAGHNANQDNPEAFDRLLLDFLAEHHPPDDLRT